MGIRNAPLAPPGLRRLGWVGHNGGALRLRRRRVREARAALVGGVRPGSGGGLHERLVAVADTVEQKQPRAVEEGGLLHRLFSIG